MTIYDTAVVHVAIVVYYGINKNKSGYMIENESSPTTDQYGLIINTLEERYPQMVLPQPLVSHDFDIYIPGMNVQEKRFAQYLLTKDLIVFREPELIGFPFVPDFFVYNPFCDRGKLVEITLFNKEFSNGNSSLKCKRRKKRQTECIESCGIPYVILYRDNMESIKRYSIPNLF